jgi:hypothetical membrane protein
VRALALGGVAGPALFAVVTVLVASLRPEYSHVANFISKLGATGTSDAALMNYAGFVPAGTLLTGFGVSLGKLLPRGGPVLVASVLATVFGLGILASGLLSCDPGCPRAGGSVENFIHDKIAPVSFLSLIAAVGILGVHFRRLSEWRPVALYSLLTCIVALGFFVALVGSLETRILTGLWQRLMLGTLFLWTSVVGIRAFRATPAASVATRR